MGPKKDKRSSDAKKNKDSAVNLEDDEESRSSAFTPIPPFTPRSIYGQQQLHHPIAPRVRWPPLQEQTEPSETRSDKRPTEEPIVKENLVKRLVGQLDPAKSTFKSDDQKMKSSSSTSFHPTQTGSNYSAAKPPPAPRLHEIEDERQQSVKSIIEKLQPAASKPAPLSKSVSSGFKPSKPPRQQPLQFREIEPTVFHKPPVATFSGYKSNSSLNKPPRQESQLIEKKPSEENLHPRKVVYNSYQEAVRAIETNISRTDLDYESRVEEATKEYKRQSQLSFGSDTQKSKSQETFIENDFWKEETQKTNSLEEFEALERTLELQDPDFDFDKRVAQSIREHKRKQEKSNRTFPLTPKMQKNELQEVFRERSKSHTDIDYESRVEEVIKKYRSQSQLSSESEAIARQEAALKELSISDSDFEQHVQESISNYKLNRQQQQKSKSVISQKPKESQERSESELDYDYEQLVDESIRTHKLRQQQQSQEELNPKKSELEEIFEAKERSKSSSHMGQYDQESTIGNRKDTNKVTKKIQSKLSSEAMQEFKKRQFSSSSEIQQIEEIQDSDIDKRIEESIRANRQKQQQEAVFQRAKAQKNEPLETSFQSKNIPISQQKIPKPTISKVQKSEDQNITPRSYLITESDNNEIRAPRIIPRPKEAAETRRSEVTLRRNPQLSIDIQNVHKSRIGWQNPKSNFIFDLIVSQHQSNERDEFRKIVSFFVLNKLNDIFAPPLITKSQQFVSFYRLAGTVDLQDSIDKVLVCASIALRDLLTSYFLHMKFIVIVTAYDRISRNEPTFADKCFWDSEQDERVCVVHYGDHISCVVHIYAINND